MTLASLIDDAPAATPILPLDPAALVDFMAASTPSLQRWIAASGFTGAQDQALRLPDESFTILFGVGETTALRWRYAALPYLLPTGRYRLPATLDEAAATQAAIDWALGAYRFRDFKQPDRLPARLCWPVAAARDAVRIEVAATCLVRDLVNLPANHLGPAELADRAALLAAEHGAAFQCSTGDALATTHPLIHAVGRASARAPRLVDLRWGPEDAPRVTIVGKGVCFDTGGLDLKTAPLMQLMKKDMGGAAHALALAQMVMRAGLKLRLRLLLPLVENAVSGDAFRPLDVIRARNGRTVEIGNTDAEGRLILADALSDASSERPQLLLDFATLTGAARVALGPDLPALFANDDALAAELLADAASVEDPLWRLPLFQPYANDLNSNAAELCNISGTTFAGAIYAALFLEKFVEPNVPWLHIDTFGWNASARPGRPEGGEARNLRAVFRLLQRRFPVPD